MPRNNTQEVTEASLELCTIFLAEKKATCKFIRGRKNAKAKVAFFVLFPAPPDAVKNCC